MTNLTHRGAADASFTRRRRVIVMCFVAVIALSGGVRMAALDLDPHYIWDEAYYIPDARTIMGGQIGPHGHRPSWWPLTPSVEAERRTAVTGVDKRAWWPGKVMAADHPDGGLLAIATGMTLLGESPWGGRLPSAIAGTLVIALVYPIARRLRLGRLWALAATILAAADTLLIVLSRFALLDIFVTLWTAVCIYCALRAAQSRHSLRWLALAGTALGLAAASKWSGALALLAVAAILLLPWRRRSPGWWLAAVALLTALPFAVYLATWVPYFASGHTLGQWASLQHHMWSFGLRAPPNPKQGTRPLAWIFDVRPIWTMWRITGPQVLGVVTIGNAFLWWGSVVAFVALGVQAILRRDRHLALPVLIVAALYVPWFATSRIGYIYYMAPVVPFLAVLTAAGISRLVGRVQPHCWRMALAFAAGLLLLIGGWGMAGLGDGAGGTSGGALIRASALLVGAIFLALVMLRAARATPRRPDLVLALSWVYIGAAVGFAVAFLPFLFGYYVNLSYFHHLTWLQTWR